jgi:peptidoglycan/xylan/chitin deacetylase (PgdA/CDA1 family)
MQLWSLNSYDYLYQAAAPLAERLHTRLQSGDIVLLHDAGETGRATAAALPSILTDILSRGWRSECLDK